MRGFGWKYAFVESDWAATRGWLAEIDWTDDEGAYLAVTLSDQPLSATGIWLAEEHATRLALRFGFSPDGWGFQG